jgi:acyl carrier protein
MPSAPQPDDLAAEIVSAALSVDLAELTPTSEMYDFPSWDSLGQLNIVLALEARFDCSIDDEALFENLTKYAFIRSFVVTKLKEKRL